MVGISRFALGMGIAAWSTMLIAQESGTAEPELSDEQKAVVAAASTSKTVADAKKATADAEKAAADASKAASEAKAAAVQSKFGPLADIESSGEVTTGTTGGKMEGTLLAAAATQRAGDQIGERVCRAIAASSVRKTDCTIKVSPPDQSDAGARKEMADAPKALVDRAAVAAGGDEACTSLGSFARARGGRSAGQAVVFVTESAALNFDVFDTFMVTTASIGRQLCHAIQLARRAADRNRALLILKPQARRGSGSEGMTGGGFDPVTAVATAVDTVAKLFRTEYTIGTYDLTPDDQLLLKAAMLSFRVRRPDVLVFSPELFPLTVSSEGNPVIERLVLLDQVRSTALELLPDQVLLEQKLRKLGEQVSDKEAVRVIAAAEEQKAAVELLKAASDAYGSFLTSASSPQNDKPATLPAALRQGRTVEVLDAGGVLVVTKVHLLAASTYSKKNFFTAFGGMPFFAAGGTVVSYAAMDGPTGQLLDSASLPVSGGFHRVSEVPTYVDGAQRANGAGAKTHR